jgi:hypothetical protein
MPAVIDSAPDCIVSQAGTETARTDDSADFILQADYGGCADVGGGIMTFGPGTTYGPEGTGADTAYYILTWVGITFVVVMLIAWVVYEHRELIREAARLARSRAGGRAA